MRGESLQGEIEYRKVFTDILHGGNGAAWRAGHQLKALWQLGDFVAVAHPHRAEFAVILMIANAIKEGAFGFPVIWA